ncbi:MAG: type II secretion system protein GspJ [Burkholderiaceae bacterium]
MTRCRSNKPSRTTGFTLLELLIAVVLMALLSVMCWRGLQSIIDSRDRITLAANEIRAMSTAFTQMDQDLRRSWPVRLFNLPQRPIMFLSGDSDSDPLILLLLRESVASEPLQVQQVLYRLNDGVLERGFSKWSATGYTDIRLDEMIWQPLINGVEGLAFRAWIPGTGWLAGRGLLELAARPRPPAAQTAAGTYDGPVGVEITLNRAGESVRRLFAVED